MKKITISVAFIALITILGGCNKDTVTPPSSYQNAKAKQTNSGPVTISGLSASSGIVYSAVTITGSNFDTVKTNNVVKFNGVAALVNSATNTQIVATVLPGATTGPVTVTTAGTTATSPNTFKVLQLVSDGSVLSTNAPNYSLQVGSLSFNQNITYAMINGNKISKYINNSLVDFYQVPGSLVSSTYAFYITTRLVFDNQGNGYIGRRYQEATDYGPPILLKSEIIKITPGGDTSVFAGGAAGYAEGNGINAKFGKIVDLASDANGNIYVADPGNYRIRKITPAGDVSTIAGGIDSSSNAGFNAIAMDNTGNIYVGGLNIRKITPGGIVSTIFNGHVGISTISMITDAAGNLFVSEFDVRKPGWNIRVINQAGYAVIPNLSNVNFGGYVGYEFYGSVKLSIDGLGRVYVIHSDGQPYIIARYSFK